MRCGFGHNPGFVGRVLGLGTGGGGVSPTLHCFLNKIIFLVVGRTISYRGFWYRDIRINEKFSRKSDGQFVYQPRRFVCASCPSESITLSSLAFQDDSLGWAKSKNSSNETLLF